MGVKAKAKARLRHRDFADSGSAGSGCFFLAHGFARFFWFVAWCCWEF